MNPLKFVTIQTGCCNIAGYVFMQKNVQVKMKNVPGAGGGCGEHFHNL